MTAPCQPYVGSIKSFQEKAAIEFDIAGLPVATWSWITTTCKTPQCLELCHLRVHAPMKLAYPYGICTYCGRHANTKDHLLPRSWTGDVQRHFVVTVPACRTCNSLLSDTLTTSITERRAIAHARIRKHFRKVLKTVEFGPSDLADLGENLRQYVVDSMAKKAEVLRMLEWPTDEGYDLRAITRSGIDDPFILGLVLADDNPEMLARVREVA